MSDVGLAVAVLLGIPALLWALVKVYCVRAEQQRVFPAHVDSAAQIRVHNDRNHERDPESTEILPLVDDLASPADSGCHPAPEAVGLGRDGSSDSCDAAVAATRGRTHQ